MGSLNDIVPYHMFVQFIEQSVYKSYPEKAWAFLNFDQGFIRWELCGSMDVGFISKNHSGVLLVSKTQ